MKVPVGATRCQQKRLVDRVIESVGSGQLAISASVILYPSVPADDNRRSCSPTPVARRDERRHGCRQRKVRCFRRLTAEPRRMTPGERRGV